MRSISSVTAGKLSGVVFPPRPPTVPPKQSQKWSELPLPFPFSSSSLQLPTALQQAGIFFILFYFKTCPMAAELLVHSGHIFKCFLDMMRASNAYYKKLRVSKYHLGPRAQAFAATANVIKITLGVSNYKKWSPHPEHILVSPSGMPPTVASAGRGGKAGHIAWWFLHKDRKKEIFCLWISGSIYFLGQKWLLLSPQPPQHTEIRPSS